LSHEITSSSALEKVWSQDSWKDIRVSGYIQWLSRHWLRHHSVGLAFLANKESTRLQQWRSCALVRGLSLKT